MEKLIREEETVFKIRETVFNITLRRKLLPNIVQVIRMHEFYKRVWVLVQVRLRSTQQDFVARVDVQHLLIVAGTNIEDLVEIFGNLSEPFFTFAQGFFGGFAVRNITR